MSLPRYAEYKDSGVEWLGEVPAHWESWKLFHAFGAIGSGTTPPSDELVWYTDGSIPWVTTGELRENLVSVTAKNVTDAAVMKFPALRIHPAGSLAIAMYGATIGRLGILAVDATTNQACCVLSQPRSLDVRFVFHWLLGFKQKLIDLYATGGGQPNISKETIASLRIPAPDLSEQSAIVAFLDRETAKIDALIAEQEKLLTLLAEKRQATISHAVTRGLNPNAAMKDSGVPWLGEVPAHWLTGALTRISERVVVGIAEAATHAYRDEGVAILRSTNIRAGRIQGEILYIAPEFAAERGSKLIAAGDLVTVRTGNPGVTAVLPAELDQCQCFTMLITTLHERNSSSYYCYWMNSEAAMRYFQLEGWGSAQLNISVPILKFLPVTIPPLSEQEAIVDFLDAETATIDGLVGEARDVIGLLKERRSALIAAAVTGKIDVRQAA